MKATYKVNSNLIFEIESKEQKGLFEELSNIQEVFGENSCGKCKSTDLQYRVRENDGNKFYEIKCKKCGARFSFGVHKQGGGLFPKRKDSEGKWLNSGGWLKWNAETKTEE
jgi:hypothetical protein